MSGVGLGDGVGEGLGVGVGVGEGSRRRGGRGSGCRRRGGSWRRCRRGLGHFAAVGGRLADRPDALRRQRCGRRGARTEQARGPVQRLHAVERRHGLAVDPVDLEPALAGHVLAAALGAVAAACGDGGNDPDRRSGGDRRLARRVRRRLGPQIHAAGRIGQLRGRRRRRSRLRLRQDRRTTDREQARVVDARAARRLRRAAAEAVIPRRQLDRAVGGRAHEVALGRRHGLRDRELAALAVRPVAVAADLVGGVGACPRCSSG